MTDLDQAFSLHRLHPPSFCQLLGPRHDAQDRWLHQSGHRPWEVVRFCRMLCCKICFPLPSGIQTSWQNVLVHRQTSPWTEKTKQSVMKKAVDVQDVFSLRLHSRNGPSSVRPNDPPTAKVSGQNRLQHLQARPMKPSWTVTNTGILPLSN